MAKYEGQINKITSFEKMMGQGGPEHFKDGKFWGCYYLHTGKYSEWPSDAKNGRCLRIHSNAKLIIISKPTSIRSSMQFQKPYVNGLLDEALRITLVSACLR